MEKLKVDFTIESDEEILASMKEAYNNCPTAIKYCRDIGIPEEKVDEYITKIFDFVCDINYCKQCKGVKNCAKNNPLLIAKVVYKNNIVENQLVPCKELLRQVTFEKQFKVRDFPEEWLSKSIRDLDETNEKKHALKKFTDFINGRSEDWIYLTGGVSSGKSYFAATITIEAAKRNLGPICFINCAQRFREMNDLSFKKDDVFQKELDKYCNCPILVLDDFGNEFKNDFVRDAIVYQILSIRNSKHLFTIITSDFSIEEIKTLYSTSKQSEIRANQISRLLIALCKKEINLGELRIY